MDCVFGGVRVEATWLRNELDDDAVSCVTPTAHDVTLSPQMSRAVVPVRLAPTHTTVASEAVLSYTCRGAADGTLLETRDGPRAGGRDPVSIQGANLNRTSHCACRFGTTVVECASRTDRVVECVAPHCLGEDVLASRVRRTVAGQ